MGRHLLIYDVEWWILGKHAKVIQQYHPSLDLMSIGELDRYLERHSSEDMNQAYDRIGAMCLGIATYCIFKTYSYRCLGGGLVLLFQSEL